MCDRSDLTRSNSSFSVDLSVNKNDVFNVNNTTIAGNPCRMEAGISTESKSLFRKRLGLYLAAATCQFSSMGAGMVIGFTAPTEPKMQAATSRVPLTKDEFSWFGSVMALGALVGGLAGGPISDRIGRKAALILCAVPCFLGWMLITYGNDLITLTAGRAFNGFYVGVTCVVAPQYLVEISTVDTRGALGNTFQLALCLGLMMSNLIGVYIPWSWLAISAMAPLILLMTTMIFVPETPQWFVLRGRFSEAVSSLVFLHGKGQDTADEMVLLSGNMSKGTPESKDDNQFEFSLMKERKYYLPSIYSLLLMFFQQFSGVNAISFYTVEIIESSGTSLKPFYGMMIINVVGIIIVLFSTVLTDRLGRRILLMVSGGGEFLSLFVLGLFFYLKAQKGNDFIGSFGWLGLASLVSYIIFFALGFGPIPWMIISELVPPRAKGIVGGVAIAVNWTCVFVITKTFTDMNRGLQPYGTYWFYALMAAAGGAFTWYCIPETKGKTLEEISRHFEIAERGAGDDDATDVDNEFPKQRYSVSESINVF